MSDLTFIDSAWPMARPPASDGIAFYIGGDTPHVWLLSEIEAQPARFRLPIFVRSNPPGPGAAADVAAALTQLLAIGAPRGCLVAWDMEMAADPSYMQQVYTLVRAAGYVLIDYGSQSAVFGNRNPDGYYFGADWTGAPHIAPGNVMTQWISTRSYDEELAIPTLPFWDTRPPVSNPPPEDDMTTEGTIPADAADWAHTWESGSRTFAAFQGGPPMPGKSGQLLTVFVHSRAKGYSQEQAVTAAGKKQVVSFDEKDVDGISMARGGLPGTWTPVAYNAA